MRLSDILRRFVSHFSSKPAPVETKETKQPIPSLSSGTSLGKPKTDTMPGVTETKPKSKYDQIPGPLGLASASLEGKVALVTGAGRGIGREMALELGRRGAKVFVNYANSDSAANEVVNLIKKNGTDAAAVKANVADVDQIVRMFEEAVKKFGKLDIVCSNSGVVSFGHVKDVTPEEFDRVFNINTRGQFFVAREAYKHLSVGGRLILMGSITGQAKAVPKHAVYSASKGAIETFVRCMAIDFGDKKITVNAVAPGGIKTDMYHAVCKEYIPGGEKLDDEGVDEVSSFATLGISSEMLTRLVRRWLVAAPPRRSPDRYRPCRLLPRVPGR
jgi:tetrahydroxynaphthalene reductase